MNMSSEFKYDMNKCLRIVYKHKHLNEIIKNYLSYERKKKNHQRKPKLNRTGNENLQCQTKTIEVSLTNKL